MTDSTARNLYELLFRADDQPETITFDTPPRPQPREHNSPQQHNASAGQRTTTMTTEGKESGDKTATLRTYTVNGRTITVKKKATTSTELKAVYTKADRAKLDNKGRMDLLDKIQAKQQRDLYRSLTISVNDPQKMTTTRSLTELLIENKWNLLKFDLLDVYQIVFPTSGAFDEQSDEYGQLKLNENGHPKAGEPIQQDMFTHYLKLTAADVAESSMWFSRFADDTHITDDLRWSLSYYEKNVEADLYSKVYSKMSRYPFDAHGGPLFLKLLLELVTTSSEGNLRALEMILETYKIKPSCPGEDIETVVGLFSSIIETIHALRNSELPSDTVRKLLRVFQSTSVPDFNAQFDVLENAYVRSSIQDQLSGEFDFIDHGKRLKNDLKSAQYVLAYAERAYRDLLQSGEWDKCLQKTPGKSAFMGKSEQQPLEHDTNRNDSFHGCHNCGSPNHVLRDCDQPIDDERVARNRAKAGLPPLKPTRRGRPHKWRLPEPGENNKRVVNGKPYTWNPNIGRSGRWVEDKTPSDGHSAHEPPPTHVSIGDGSIAQGNITMSSLETAIRNLLVADSSSSDNKQDDNSTIKTKDPMERKLRLTMLRQEIDDFLDKHA